MVVLYGFLWKGRNLILDGKRVKFIKSVSPYEPDKEIKNVVPFCPPLAARKPGGKTKSNYYIKDIAKSILKVGCPETSYIVIDGYNNVLVPYKDIDKAMENGYSAEKYLNFFRQANSKLTAKNSKQIKGSVWRKGFWGAYQADYYYKKHKYDKAIKIISDLLDDDDVPEKYRKKAEETKKLLVKRLIGYMKTYEKKLKSKSKKTKEEAIEQLKVIKEYLKDEKELMAKIDEICKKTGVKLEDENSGG